MPLVTEAVLTFYACVYSTRFAQPALFLFAALGLLFATRGSLALKGLYFFVPLFLGICLSLISGSSPGPTAETAMALFGGFGWFIAGGLMPTRLSGRIFSFTAALLSLLAIAERLLTGEIPRLWMVSPIDLGLAILLLGLLGQTRRLTYLALIFAGAAMSTSRALILAAAAGVFLSLDISRRWKIAVVSVLIIAALPSVIERISGDRLAWQRAGIYMATTNLILERPVTGWGLGAFRDVSRRALLPDPLLVRRMRVANFAHNDPLELIFEVGIPLAAMIFAGALLLFGAARKERRPVVAAAAIVSLFYFPFRLGFPLFAALFACGRPGLSAPKISWSVGISGALILLYGYGIYAVDPEIALFNARIQVEARRDYDGIDAMKKLEPERPESWQNEAVYAAMAGSTGGAIRGFEASVARAPTETPLRLELVRAYRWRAASLTDTAERERCQAIASMHLGYIRAVEPLFLAALRDTGDTIAYDLAVIAIDRLEREGEPAQNIEHLRRTVD